MKKLFKKAVSVLLALALSIGALGTLIACNDGGSLKFQSMTVDTSAVETRYAIGGEVAFDGLKASIKYNDDSHNVVVGINDLELVFPEGKNIQNLTAFSGTYEIIVKYQDKVFTGTTRTAKFTVYVASGKESAIGLSHTLPSAYADYQQEVASANDTGTDDNFFTTSDSVYCAGSQNDFIFLPNLLVMRNGSNLILPEYVADIKMSIWVESAYVELTKYQVSEDISTYSDETTTYVNVNSYTHHYTFNDAANGKQFKIEITPSQQYYGPMPTLAIEVKVIDAYNVYNENDLAAFDNTQEVNAVNPNLSTDHIGGDLVGTWGGAKAQGVGVAENGIVLHRSLTLTQNHIPSSFYWAYGTQSDGPTYVYPSTNTSTNQSRAYFLHDRVSVYRRYMTNDTPFNFVGNFFQIDVSSFPVIASTNVSSIYNYGADYSNSQLFDIETASYDAKINFMNINFKGNAPISGDVDIVGGEPVNAGGLIFIRTIRDVEDSDTFLTVNAENVITTCFFIGYKPEIGTTLNLDKIKLRDSCYNAIFAISNTKINIANSYLQRAGGPLIMMQYRFDDKDNASPRLKTQIPEVYATNSVLESYVDGSEIWFKATHSDGYLGNMKAMDPLFNFWMDNSILSNDTANDRNGKLNIICVNMSDGTDATGLINKIDTQGYFKYDYATDKSVVMNRKVGTEFGAYAMMNYGTAATAVKEATVVGMYVNDNMNGGVPTNPIRYIIQSSNPQTFSNLNGNGDDIKLEDVEDRADAGLASIKDSNYLSLLLGGFGIVIQLFPMA